MDLTTFTNITNKQNIKANNWKIHDCSASITFCTLRALNINQNWPVSTGMLLVRLMSSQSIHYFSLLWWICGEIL